MKKNHFFSILTSLLLLVGTFCHGQTPSNLDINQLNEQLAKGALKETDYLASVNSWVNEQFAAGMHFERDSLMNALATFRDLAWSADSLDAQRINYFIYLSNNANYANREGESVYFLEKAEQEVLAAHGEKPLMVAGRKSNTYIDKRNYKNVIATYEKDKAYIEQFPELLRLKKINLNIAASFINVLNPAINAYAKLRDTVRLNETLALAEAIHNELQKRLKPEHNTMFTVNFYMHQLYYYKYFTLEDNKQKAREALQAMQQTLYGDTTRPASLVGLLEPVLATRFVEYFLKYRENDSTAYYLDKLKTIPGVFTDHDFTLNHFEAELLANQGLYHQAYEHANAAMYAIDSIQSILVNDIDELLYAHTDAEYSRQALLASEHETKRRTVWLLIISFVVGAIGLTVYLMMRRREKIAKARIEKLDQMANIQVAAMEEIKHEAVREEQQRLGQDLHDGLSSSLAGIRHQLETLAIDTDDLTLKNKLGTLQAEITGAYEAARNKSHEWFRAAEEQQEQSFEQRVKLLVDSALPDIRYDKDIHIDNGSLMYVSVDTRIALLRIIQEAITNIIKHAKAKNVGILIYAEMDSLVLSIKDDGIGLIGKKTTGGKSTLGLQSIRRRIQYLDGELEITSDTNGTEIAISIPIQSAEPFVT